MGYLGCHEFLNGVHHPEFGLEYHESGSGKSLEFHLHKSVGTLFSALKVV